MYQTWSLTAGQAAGFAAVAGALVVASAVGYRAWRRGRIPAEERERRRRAALVSHGKITDATLVEILEHVLVYSYVVRGVEYTACQDVTGLESYMPGEMGLGVRPVSVRYDAKNPADSIVLAERWSGLRLK